MVEPYKEPYIKRIKLDLESLQTEVKGLISAVYPFEDQVALICNDEGKILHMAPNRSLKDNAGQIYDIICGPFLITGLTSNDFGSLSEALINKYMEHFKTPELFTMISGKIISIPTPPE